MARGRKDLGPEAKLFSYELNRASEKCLGNFHFASSLYLPTSGSRILRAKDSDLLTDEELKHPHLNSDHSDREILHDYIRLVIRKCEERMNND